jgi:hypothetical protein
VDDTTTFRRAVEIIENLLATPDLNLDELKADTVRAIEEAEAFLSATAATATPAPVTQNDERTLHTTEPLLVALQELASMEHPSVSGILRKMDYEYEARKVEAVVSAWKQFDSVRPK